MLSGPARSSLRPRNARPLRIGFLPLVDAASVIVSSELGYFSDEGLDVVLCRELGWANVRDKLAFRRLDAAHAVIGLPLRSAMHGETAADNTRAVMALGTGGDAITLSSAIVASGVSNAVTLGRYVRQSRGRRLVLAHVFESSVHHYLLREWLDAGEIDPDRDVQLCVLPPTQMAAHLAAGHIDGFCSGEPWHTVAQEQGVGRIVALTCDLMPAHPDKVLAVSRAWADAEPLATVAMIRAVLRGCDYCADESNFAELAEILSGPDYLDLSPQTVLSSLTLGRRRAEDWPVRTFDTTFPSHAYTAWMIDRMQRWGHADSALDPWLIAGRAMPTDAYRAAAVSAGRPCPVADDSPLRLRNGLDFARRRPPGAVLTFEGATV